MIRLLTTLAWPMVFFGLAVYAAWLAVATPASPPALAVVGSDVVDLGTLRQGATAVASFELVNNSTNIVKVENVAASCGCTKPSISSKEILPGEHAHVEVEYHPTSARGKASEWAEVRYWDSEKKLLIGRMLWLKATVIPDYDVAPPHLNFRAGEAAVQHVMVAPNTIERLEVKNVTCNRACFSVFCTAGPQPGTYAISVTFDPSNYDETAGEATLSIRTNSLVQPTFYMPLKVVEPASTRD